MAQLNEEQSSEPEEINLRHCPACGGYHADVDACPLAPKRYAVVRSWRTDIMPAPAFTSVHLECWDDTSITPTLVEQPYKNGALRLVPLTEMATYATCDECGKPFILQP